ncbi:MerR family transcriptional regulator [Paenibacillus silvae]|nr:MerR family transcriptional regulator [Paenibacillus silvae]MCK6148234.1 MerR family transcriptional regulator [Paenibacillus silvae]MCK6266534.1 MerR family transcriptional regulator [Paenibacillus silvae]
MMSGHMMFSIHETSERSGLSKDTIRYYEKIGLLPRAERKASRHRVYSEQDIQTMSLITCLKKTGMSLEEMKPFLHMSLESDLDDFPDEREMLINYQQKVKEQITSLQQVIDFIDDKLAQRSMFPEKCEINDEHLLTGLEKKNTFS